MKNAEGSALCHYWNTQNNESFCGAAIIDHNQRHLIDDVIRHNLEGIFNILTTKVSLHIWLKLDAQLDIDSDLSKSMLEKFRQV
jgi:hypothetical protein